MPWHNGVTSTVSTHQCVYAGSKNLHWDDNHCSLSWYGICESVGHGTDLSDIKAEVASNSINIASNTVDISDNAAAIGSNDADISSNTADISSNTAQITINTADIEKNALNILHCPTNETNTFIVDGGCYTFVDQVKNPNDAKSYCESRHGFLFEPRSAHTNEL